MLHLFSLGLVPQGSVIETNMGINSCAYYYMTTRNALGQRRKLWLFSCMETVGTNDSFLSNSEYRIWSHLYKFQSKCGCQPIIIGARHIHGVLAQW